MNRSIAILIILVLTACSRSEQSTEQSSSSSSKPEFRVMKEYKPEEVKSFDSATLRLKRNEIFAQYGYIFKSPELSEYFNNKQWYEPVNSNVDSFLTKLDKKNIELFLTREAKLKQIRDFDCRQVTSELSEFIFNSSIQAVIDSLGKPKKSFIDQDEFCPGGQLHYWDQKEDELEIIVLGDSYQDSVNLNTSSRLYAIKTTNKFDVSNFGFSGIFLGEDSPLVELKLNCLTERLPEFEFYKSTGSSAVERYFAEGSDIYVLTNKKIWIHFSINPFDRLDYLLFATLNARGAC